MELTYLGHSAFRLRGKDVTIVTDPHPPQLGQSMGKVSADIVTVSHPSPNHSYKEGVAGEPKGIEGPGEYEIADVLIAGVATDSELGVGAKNTAYVFRLEDLIVCHLGDLSSKLTNEQVEELGAIDVLLVPVGGAGALNAMQASEVVAQLEPSLVIPMHYKLNGADGKGTKGLDGLEPVEYFCREMGSKDYSVEPKLTVTKSSLPSEVDLKVLESRRI